MRKHMTADAAQVLLMTASPLYEERKQRFSYNRKTWEYIARPYSLTWIGRQIADLRIGVQIPVRAIIFFFYYYIMYKAKGKN